MEQVPKDDDKRSFKYNRICVVESLREKDKRTGKDLFKDLLAREAYRTPGLSASYKYCRTKIDLKEHLIRIKQDASTGQVMPFVHFECHGNKKGIALESGELMQWEELVPFLVEINVVTKNNLFISFATCYAFNIYAAIAGTISQRSPCFGFISSPEEIYPDEYVSGYYEFFEQLLYGSNLLNAIDALNSNCAPHEKFVFEYGEKIFNKAWDAYDAEFNNPESYNKKLFDQTNRLLSVMWIRHRFTIPQLIGLVKETISAEGRNAMREEMKTHFLMLDLNK